MTQWLRDPTAPVGREYFSPALFRGLLLSAAFSGLLGAAEAVCRVFADQVCSCRVRARSRAEFFSRYTQPRSGYRGVVLALYLHAYHFTGTLTSSYSPPCGRGAPLALF